MKTISPRQIFDILDKRIIGQKDAKRQLSNILFTHYTNIVYRRMTGKKAKTSNFLLMGPSGNGKTMLINEGVKAVRELTELDIMPLLNVDSTSLHPEGWSGINISDVLEAHKEHTTRESFKSTVMYFDEFDKLTMPMVSAGGGDTHKQMQYAMLTLIEGTDYNVGSSGHKGGSSYDVSDFLFIFSGNFPNLRKDRDDEDKYIGFTKAEDNSVDEDLTEDLFIQLTKSGLATQLAGRISSVVEIKALKHHELVDIMNQLVLPQARDMYEFMGHKLEVPSSQINSMVEKAVKRKTGARGLQASLQEYLQDTLFEQSMPVVEPVAVLQLVQQMDSEPITMEELFNKPPPDVEYTKEEIDDLDLDPDQINDFDEIEEFEWGVIELEEPEEPDDE